MSMDDSEIDLFLSETNALDSSLYIEPTLSCLPKETMTNLMGSTISTSSPNQRNHLDTLPPTNSQMPAFIATSHPPSSSMLDPIDNIGFGHTVETINQTPTYFTSEKFLINKQSPHDFTNQNFSMSLKEALPSASFPSLLMDPEGKSPSTYFSTQSILVNSEELPSDYFSIKDLPMNPESQPPQGYFACQNILLTNEEYMKNSSSYYPQMPTKVEQHQLPGEFLPPSYIDFKIQSSEVLYRPFNLTSNFTNAMGDLLNHDPEATLSFLAGLVRPGPDVTQIYKCNKCSVEFANAQAFGGHMSSHSKNKRTKNPMVAKGGKSKRSKHGSIEASSSHSSKSKAKVARREMTKKKSAGKKTNKNKGVQKEHGRAVEGNMGEC